METAPPEEPLRVLLVEDDEDDYILTRDLSAEFRGQRAQLDWKRSFSDGLEAMIRNQHDICLVDYRLGAQNGIELLRAALDRGCRAPVILLTGQGEHEIDVEAMKAGAADTSSRRGSTPACSNARFATPSNASAPPTWPLRIRRGWPLLVKTSAWP